MHVYVQVSSNHGYSLEYVLRHKFDPEIKLLIMYYNYKTQLEQKEYEKMEKEQQKYK